MAKRPRLVKPKQLQLEGFIDYPKHKGADIWVNINDKRLGYFWMSYDGKWELEKPRRKGTHKMQSCDELSMFALLMEILGL